MTTFKTVVRRKRADGFYPVYIRVVHRTKMGYISTGKIVTDKQILKSGDIKDPVVNEYCSRQILRFSEIMNKKDFTNFSVSDLIDYLLHFDEDVCFSEYASQFIARMEREGHDYRRIKEVAGKPFSNQSGKRNVPYLCSADFQKSYY